MGGGKKGTFLCLNEGVLMECKGLGGRYPTNGGERYY